MLYTILPLYYLITLCTRKRINCCDVILQLSSCIMWGKCFISNFAIYLYSIKVEIAMNQKIVRILLFTTANKAFSNLILLQESFVCLFVCFLSPLWSNNASFNLLYVMESITVCWISWEYLHQHENKPLTVFCFMRIFCEQTRAINNALM